MKPTKLIAVTDEEADLIEAMRNYVKSYPDGYPGTAGLCTTIV